MLSTAMMEKLNAYKTRYLQGQLTADELSAQLLEEIEAESAKPDDQISNAWLEACAQLMARIDADRAADLPDRQQETWQAIRGDIAKTKQRQHRGLRIAAAAACLVLLLGTGVTLRWLHPSQQGESYRLAGQEVQLGGASAQADPTPRLPGLMDTLDLAEAAAFLGFTPPTPQALPEGWSLARYYAYNDGKTLDFTAAYTHASRSGELRYIHARVSDVPGLVVDFLQDGKGSYTALPDGRTVYVTTHGEGLVAVWQTADTYSCLAGPVTREALLTMASSIK